MLCLFLMLHFIAVCLGPKRVTLRKVPCTTPLVKKKTTIYTCLVSFDVSSKNHFCLTKEGESLCHCVITVNLTESLGAHHTFIQILKLNCTQMLFPPPHKMGSMAIKWKTDHTAPCWPSLTCLSSKYLSNKRLWRTAHPLRGSVRDMKVLLFLPAADFRGLMNNSRRDEWRGGGRRYSGSTFIGFDVISSHLIYSCPRLCLCSWTAHSEKKEKKRKVEIWKVL